MTIAKQRTKTGKIVMVLTGLPVGSVGGTMKLSMPRGNDRRYDERISDKLQG
jgi:hypothetical protein